MPTARSALKRSASVLAGRKDQERKYENGPKLFSVLVRCMDRPKLSPPLWVLYLQVSATICEVLWHASLVRWRHTRPKCRTYTFCPSTSSLPHSRLSSKSFGKSQCKLPFLRNPPLAQRPPWPLSQTRPPRCSKFPDLFWIPARGVCLLTTNKAV